MPEKESIEHCSYTVMFTILSGFMGISLPREYTCLASQPTEIKTPKPNRSGSRYDTQMLRGDAFDGFQVRATFKLRSIFDRGHFDMDIDALEQRAGNF